MNVLTEVGDTEIEIQTLLSSFTSELDGVASLRDSTGGKMFALDQQASICEYFLRSNRPEEIVRFLIAQRSLRNIVHWTYFALSLHELSDRLASPEKIDFLEMIRGCYHLAIEAGQSTQVFANFGLAEVHDEIERNSEINWVMHRSSVRERLVRECETYRSQDLDEQFAGAIKRWTLTFPDDEEPKKFATNLREQRALATLEKKIDHWKHQWSEEPGEAMPEPLRHDILRSLKESPQSRSDLALAAVFLGEHLLAAEILRTNLKILDAEFRNEFWLLLDSLVGAALFVELLEYAEKFQATTPDEIAARTFYHAQALWGLEQRKDAIELLETLARTFPDYPRAEGLLADWKGFVN